MDEFSLWSRIVQQLRSSCLDFDRLWMKRRRVFDTESLVTSLIQLVGGTQSSYFQTMDQLPMAAGATPAASSFCVARAKLPSYVVGEIRQDVLDVWDEHRPGNKWHGRRLYAVDGSKVTLPQPLFQHGFTAPGKGHCPQGLVSILLRLDDQMICDMRLSRDENEREEAFEHLAQLGADDLVIYDRGYLSFVMLTAHAHHGVDAVFRVSRESFLPVEEFWTSRQKETVVTIDPSAVTYRLGRRQHSELNFKPLQLRLIKYRIGTEAYVLATTVLDSTVPGKAIVALYARRWQAEEAYKSFKQTLSMNSFHAKTTRGVEQEVQAISLLWNLTLILAALSGKTFKKTQQSVQLHHITKSTISRDCAKSAAISTNC